MHVAPRFRSWLFLALVLRASLASALGAAAEDLQLTLPPAVYAVVGVETSIYFDNVVLTQTPSNYRFQVEAGFGMQEARRWTFTPDANHVGRHRLSLQVKDASNRVLGQAETQLYVSAADAGAKKPLRLLIVGDSLTHATAYPNELARLLSQPGNPEWTMLGTHRPPQAAAGVAHEGYGGWTWERFVTYFGNPPAPAGRPSKSPFVFADGDGRPVFDVARYLDESCGGQRPDVVFFLLGINDCFGANPEDLKAMDGRIDAVLASADKLLEGFHKAAPEADLAIGLTTPPNVREEAFVANYSGNYHRWGWKRIQHRLVQRELKHFGDRDPQHLFVVPTELMLDSVDGYPENNAVHPNAAGYRQIGTSIYAWLKWRESQPERPDK